MPTLNQPETEMRERISRALHYPDCWDTAAYPTLESATWGAIACARLGCSVCETPPASSTAAVSDAAVVRGERDKLPPLPESDHSIHITDSETIECFRADQMREYARAALAQSDARGEPVEETIQRVIAEMIEVATSPEEDVLDQVWTSDNKAQIDKWQSSIASARSAPQPKASSVDGALNFAEYRRGLREAFDFANMINANRQDGRTAEDTCTEIVRVLATLANGEDAAPQPKASSVDSAVPEGFIKTVQSLCFLCRTETQRLDDETLACLTKVEDKLVSMGLSVKDSDGELIAAPTAAVDAVTYDDVVSICDAHGLGLPVDCVEIVVEIIKHARSQS